MKRQLPAPAILVLAFLANFSTICGQEPEAPGLQLTVDARHAEKFGLLTIGIDGKTGQLETSANMPLVEPAWSPDGRQLAFVSFENGPGQICVIDAETKHVTRLTNKQDWERNPTWSPDRKKIAFACLRENNSFRLFVMNADGSEQRPLHERELRGWLFPHWSPDGKWIVVGELRETLTDVGVTRLDVALLLLNLEKRA